MKRFFSIFMMLTLINITAFSNIADEAFPSEEIPLDPIGNYDENSGRHRSGLQPDLHAEYNLRNHSINVFYGGEGVGEVYLYLDNTLIASSPIINTSFPLTSSGLYRIEIVTFSWKATGSITVTLN